MPLLNALLSLYHRRIFLWACVLYLCSPPCNAVAHTPCSFLPRVFLKKLLLSRLVRSKDGIKWTKLWGSALRSHYFRSAGIYIRTYIIDLAAHLPHAAWPLKSSASVSYSTCCPSDGDYGGRSPDVMKGMSWAVRIFKEAHLERNMDTLFISPNKWIVGFSCRV